MACHARRQRFVEERFESVRAMGVDIKMNCGTRRAGEVFVEG